MRNPFAAVLFLSSAAHVYAGCVCPDLTTIETGALRVEKAKILSQTWQIERDSAKLSLTVDAEGDFQVGVVAMAMAKSEYEFNKGNEPKGETGINRDFDPKPTQRLLDAPKAVLANVRGERDQNGQHLFTVDWLVKPGKGAKKPYRLELGWNLARAGADEVPLKDKAFLEKYCVDAGTAKGLKKADGVLNVGLRLNDTSREGFELKIKRVKLPISLCASKVQKVDANTFVVKGRENLKDKDGVLPILFGESL